MQINDSAMCGAARKRTFVGLILEHVTYSYTATVYTYLFGPIIIRPNRFESREEEIFYKIS